MKRMLGGLLVLVVTGCGGGTAPTTAPIATTAAQGTPAAPGRSVAPVGDAQSVPGVDWSTTASDFRGQLGKHYVYVCPPGGSPRQIWGTNTYTDDSSVCTAAVHRGLITLASGGPVVIEIVQGAIFYLGTTKNGIESKGYGDWGGSFVFVS